MRTNTSLESIAAAMKAALEDVSQEDIIYGIVGVLEHLIAKSDQADSITKSDFDQQDIGISIGNFLDHIVTSGLCSKECYIITLIYGERMLQRNDGFQITRRNVHRLMLVSLLLASKMLDDFYCRNMYYATACGITLEALNALELKMCFMMGFNLNVSVDEFELYRDSLRREESPLPSPVLSASLDHWGVDMQLSPTLSPIPSYDPVQMSQQQPPMHPPIQPPAVQHSPVRPIPPVSVPLSVLLATPGSFIYSATIAPPQKQARPDGMPPPAQAWSFAPLTPLVPSGGRSAVWSTTGDTRMEPRGSSVRDAPWPTSSGKKQGHHASRAALQSSIGKISTSVHMSGLPAMLPPVHAIPAWLLA